MNLFRPNQVFCGLVIVNQTVVGSNVAINRALEYFRQVEASGEKVIVIDKGQPVIEVRSYQNDTRSPLERLQGSVLEFQRPTDPVSDDGEAAV